MGRPCQMDLGFFRNPYVGRSFISPSQELRDLKVLAASERALTPNTVEVPTIGAILYRGGPVQGEVATP